MTQQKKETGGGKVADTISHQLEPWYDDIGEQPKSCREWTYEIISKVAFLIGFPQQIFEDGHHPPRLEVYEKLKKDQAPRTVRSLCKIRSSLFRNLDGVNMAMIYDMKNLHTMPELFSAQDIKQLEKGGIPLIKSNRRIDSIYFWR